MSIDLSALFKKFYTPNTLEDVVRGQNSITRLMERKAIERQYGPFYEDPKKQWEHRCECGAISWRTYEPNGFSICDDCYQVIQDFKAYYAQETSELEELGLGYSLDNDEERLTLIAEIEEQRNKLADIQSRLERKGMLRPFQ